MREARGVAPARPPSCASVAAGEPRINTDDGPSEDDDYPRVTGVWCPVCGDVIGAYEPLCVVRAGSVRRSSLAREPVLSSGEEAVMHFACWSGLGVGRPEDDDISSTEAHDPRPLKSGEA